MVKFENEFWMLDLHGVKHVDVDIILDQFLYEHYGTTVKVICGNSGKMKTIVMKWLNNRGYIYTEWKPGILTVIRNLMDA